VKSTHCSALAAAVFIVAALQTMPAQAQTRVFVAAQGSDVNPCTFAQPCRTFQHAHNAVAANGEIDVLDPAGYGAVTITKSISIQGHGFSGISVGSGGTGITINAGSADKVNLNGLIIDGGGAGAVGIKFIAGKTLVIDSCNVRNMTSDGVQFFPTASSSLSVRNSSANDNSGSGFNITPSGLPLAVSALVERTSVLNNGGNGVIIDGSGSTGAINATVSESAAYNNVLIGFTATSASAHSLTTMFVNHSVSSNNNSGFTANGTNSGILVAGSTSTANIAGWFAANGSTIVSAGDNNVFGNQSAQGAVGLFSKE
jgi:hypothetical protein